MFKDAVKAFFELKEHEAILSAEGGKKMGITAVGRFFYGLLDYLIAGGLGVMVVWMNVRNFSAMEIFLATWVYDTFASALFYQLSEQSGFDITLGRSFRRSAEVMFKNGIVGKILGGLLLLGVSVKAIIWEGPEVICFLFRKELKTKRNIWLALIILSALQAVFGAWLYTTGYKLWEKLNLPELQIYQIVLLGIAIFLAFTAIVIASKKMAEWTVAAARSFWKISRKEKIIIAVSLLIIISIVIYITNDLIVKGVF